MIIVNQKKLIYKGEKTYRWDTIKNYKLEQKLQVRHGRIRVQRYLNITLFDGEKERLNITHLEMSNLVLEEVLDEILKR